MGYLRDTTLGHIFNIADRLREESNRFAAGLSIKQPSMWNSPRSRTNSSKRYEIAEIAALTYPLDQIVDSLESTPVTDVVDERILWKLDKEELIFALYEVLDALLEDTAIPKNGHRGYHEAIVAELLGQTYTQVCCELDDPERGEAARKAAWESVHRFCVLEDSGQRTLWQIESLAVDIDLPTLYLSEKITADHWHDLLLGEGGVWGEFLWDEDWQLDEILDLPPSAAKKVGDRVGIDLDQVHGLAHTPSNAELRRAERYLHDVIRKAKAAT